MKKISLTLLIVLIAISLSHGQWLNATGTGNYYLNSGNVGINTLTPGSWLDVNGMATIGSGGGRVTIDQGGWAVNRNVSNGYIYYNGSFAYQFGHLQESTTAPSDLMGFSVWKPNGDNVTINSLVLNGEGKVGVLSNYPVSLFQVDDGVSKASLGSAGDLGSALLGNGTSYLGFNAARYYSGTGTAQSWFSDTDGNNNGGGVIYGTVSGNIYFAPIASTGSAVQTTGDANIGSKVMMKITPTAVYAKQIYVQTNIFPDYVFVKNYRLLPLTQVKAYIDANHHLPEMPAAKDVIKDGLNVGEINVALTKKVEELTLYLIEKDKEIQQIRKSQESSMRALEKRLRLLEKSHK